MLDRGGRRQARQIFVGSRVQLQLELNHPLMLGPQEGTWAGSLWPLA